MRVVVRADASPTIGIGHLMRCLALAQALRDAGDAVTLVTTPDAGALLGPWHGEGATAVVISSQIGSAEDAETTRAMVRDVDAAWLVLDGYAFHADYRAKVRDASRLMVIDDHAVGPIDADAVTNGNLYATESMYDRSAGSLLVGPRFALLRREFRAPTSADVVRAGILLSLGGADPDDRTVPLLRALAARGLHGRVVIGPRHLGADIVRATAIELGWDAMEAPDEMAPLLRSCEVAVVGSGTTTLEVMAVGTPMVAVPIAENQAPVAAALERLGLAAVANASDPEGAAAAAAALMVDPARRTEMGQRGPTLVDGRGALRVAAEMRAAGLALRPASMADAALLLTWRNDPATRAASFTTGEVSWPDHLQWLADVLSDRRRILEVGEIEGVPVGVVRLDREGASAATISVTVAPEARGLGLAAALLRRAVAAAAARGIGRVDARIRPGNDASRRAFVAAGFTVVSDGTADGALLMSTSSGRQG